MHVNTFKHQSILLWQVESICGRFCFELHKGVICDMQCIETYFNVDILSRK